MRTQSASGQALAALAAYPDADWVRIEVTLLRTGRTHQVTHWRDESRELFKSWLDDLDQRIRLVGDGKNGYPYAPGANCLGCPWSHGCKASVVKGESIEELVTRLALAQNEEKRLTAQLKGLLGRGGLIQVGKSQVGFKRKVERVPREDAASQICDAWGIAETDDRARGLVAT